MITSQSSRVLVAADAELTAAHLRTVLIGAGFEVVGRAKDWRQALAVTASIRPDLVVLEVDVPDPAASAAIRDITAGVNAPLVLLTTPSRSGLIEGVVAGGSLACLVTPFVPSSLLTAIDMVLALQAEDGAQLAVADDLIRRLDDGNLVEQAKGVLMFHQQMTEAQAHRWLQQTAMHRRVRMADVAAGVIRRWVQ